MRQEDVGGWEGIGTGETSSERESRIGGVVRATQEVKHIPRHMERRIDRTGQAADGDDALHDYVGKWEKRVPCPNQKTWKGDYQEEGVNGFLMG